MADKFYSKHFVYNSNPEINSRKNGKIEEFDLTKALQKAVKSRNLPRFCLKCNQKLEYKGLGHYNCEECGTDYYTNYGKVRKTMDEYGTLTVKEVCSITGLTKDEIKELVNEGSVEISDGRVNVIF